MPNCFNLRWQRGTYRPLHVNSHVEGFFYALITNKGVSVMTKQRSRTTIHTLNGDSLTPILIFRRLQGSHKFLLESSAKNESSGRYSFIGCNPRKTYIGKEELLQEYVTATQKSYTHEGHLHVLLKRLMPRISNVTDFPFSGGAVGYIRAKGPHALPQVNFNIYEMIIVFDHLTDTVTLIHTNIDAEANTPNLVALADEIAHGTPQHFDDFTLHTEHEQQATFSGHPFSAYRHFRKTNGEAYMYYVEFQDHTCIGTAPESFIHVQTDHIRAHIISGSVEKSKHYQENAVLINDLRKQQNIMQPHQEALTARAEQLKHVSTPGSIDIIKDTAALHSRRNIHVHGVIEATLSPVLHPIDALTACVPETNDTPLGNATLGYIGFNGQLDFTTTQEAFLFTAQTVTTSASLTQLLPQQEVFV